MRKPFNLEDAKAGKRIVNAEGEEFHYVGLSPSRLRPVVMWNKDTGLCAFYETGKSDSGYTLFIEEEEYVVIYKRIACNRRYVLDEVFTDLKKAEAKANNLANFNGYCDVVICKLEEQCTMS